MIIISLFDEVEFDDRSGGGYLDDESAIRREKRFLGSVSLPFQVLSYWIESMSFHSTAARDQHERKKKAITSTNVALLSFRLVVHWCTPCGAGEVRDCSTCKLQINTMAAHNKRHDRFP